MTDALELAGQRARDEMTRLWSLDIIDPPRGSRDPRAPQSLQIINEIIRVSGWTFALPDGMYHGNGSPQWCGMTAGYAWRAAGLDPRMLQVWWASTDRLLAWASYQSFSGHANTKRPAAPADRRLLQGLHSGAALSFVPRAGDVVIVGDGKRASGQHVTVCVEYDAEARRFSTLSGNGGGVGPKGDRREGISARDFSIDEGGYRALWVIRPAFGDLLAERG